MWKPCGYLIFTCAFFTASTGLDSSLTPRTVKPQGAKVCLTLPVYPA